MLPRTKVWQSRRSEFNHDWLKNQYMPALAACLNLLDGRLEDRELEETFVAVVLPQWESHREEALMLARDFDLVMSPRSLFDSIPLSRCDGDTKQWLGDWVHSRWLARRPVEQWVADASEAVRLVDSAYQQLQEVLEQCDDTGSAKELRRFREQFSDLRDKCQQLADAISKFPREMVVT
jgi:hypothetical protein